MAAAESAAAVAILDLASCRCLVVVGCCWFLLVVVGCCWLLLVIVGCCWLLFLLLLFMSLLSLSLLLCCWSNLSKSILTVFDFVSTTASAHETVGYNSHFRIGCPNSNDDSNNSSTITTTGFDHHKVEITI